MSRCLSRQELESLAKAKPNFGPYTRHANPSTRIQRSKLRNFERRLFSCLFRSFERSRDLRNACQSSHGPDTAVYSRLLTAKYRGEMNDCVCGCNVRDKRIARVMAVFAFLRTKNANANFDVFETLAPLPLTGTSRR